MERILGLPSLLMISIVCLASVAVAQSLETCVQAALKGPEIKRIKVLDHEFNCKPIEILRLDSDKLNVAGQLSHHRTDWFDDQIHYMFIVNGQAKTYDNLKINIDLNPLSGVLGALLSSLAATQGMPISSETTTKFFREAEGLVVGNWQEAANAIITGVAMKLAGEGQP
jgi:hypothetical protein